MTDCNLFTNKLKYPYRNPRRKSRFHGVKIYLDHRKTFLQKKLGKILDVIIFKKFKCLSEM